MIRLAVHGGVDGVGLTGEHGRLPFPRSCSCGGEKGMCPLKATSRRLREIGSEIANRNNPDKECQR
jgi:hypothetical protein